MPVGLLSSAVVWSPAIISAAALLMIVFAKRNLRKEVDQEQVSWQKVKDSFSQIQNWMEAARPHQHRSQHLRGPEFPPYAVPDYSAATSGPIAERPPARQFVDITETHRNNVTESHRKEVQSSCGFFLTRFKEWPGAVLPLSFYKVLDDIFFELRDVPDFDRINALGQEFYDELPGVLRSVLSACDRDYDPTRSSAPTQKYLQEVVQHAGLKFIHPKMGEMVNTDLHRRMGVCDAKREEDRGKVAEVITRGLMAGDGRVLERAEVREYD